MVEVLLDYGGDYTETGERGETCLHAAARYNYATTCRLLIERGSGVYETDDQGRYAIHACANSLYNTSATIDYLVNDVGKTDDVNLRDFHERTPLHSAVAVRNVAVARTLLGYGSDVNAQNDAGETPLHLATRDTEMWLLLVEHGAREDLKDKRGNVPGCG